MIFEWEWTNLRDLRPYWPQTASEFEVRFQVRVGQICRILLKDVCKLYLWPQLLKPYIFWKLTKFQKIKAPCYKIIYLIICINRKIFISPEMPFAPCMYIYYKKQTLDVDMTEWHVWEKCGKGASIWMNLKKAYPKFSGPLFSRKNYIHEKEKASNID